MEAIAKEVEEEITQEKTKPKAIENEKVNQTATTTKAGDLVLNKENLERVWAKMIAWFKESEQLNLYEILNEHAPVLEKNKIALTLDSGVEKSFVESNAALIKGFLRRNFKEFEELELRVSKSTKSKKIILNQRDKFQILAKKNPLLLKLKDALNLDLEL